jgi:hypothetical protein
MEEVRSLQLKEEEESTDIESTDIGKEELLRIIKQQGQDIAVLKEHIVAQNAGSVPSPVEKAAQESAVEKVLREAEEGRSPDQLKQAEKWVARQIGGRLKVQQGPKGIDGVAPLEVIFDRYVVTPELREAGKTTLPDGFTVTHSVPVGALARYYIDIILDEQSYQSDAQKLLAIVENSKDRASHPTEFAFLFDGGGKLKPLQSRAVRRRKK